MNKEANAFWERALEAIRAANVLQSVSPDRMASTAYYASFYAVSAFFALEGKSFSKHTAVEAAVHRDLVKTGIWPSKIGSYYSELNSMRHTGDYGGLEHIAPADAKRALEMAKRIVDLVQKTHPELKG